MTNFVSLGSRLNYSNTGSAIASGAVVTLKSGGLAGGINVGVAVDTIAATTGTGVLQIGGVFSLAKTAGEAYAMGDALYWTGTALTSASTGNTWAGVAAAAAGSADTNANILLNAIPYTGRMIAVKPIYTGFFTRGSLYEAEAARLIASLDRHGLEHDIRAIDSLGNWTANTAYTATHLANIQHVYGDRPIVYLDADAVVWQPPVLFDAMPPDIDIAVHYRRGQELLNGTLYLAPTPGAWKVVEEYVRRSEHNPHNEQKRLQETLADLSDSVKTFLLPAGYCWIHDIMRDDLAPDEDLVIEHLQASRETNVSHLTANRRRRIEEIGPKLQL